MTVDIGVFIPIGNNGWLISTTSPQYKPTFALNRDIVQMAEGYGLDFALSMVKLHGFGGASEFWDYNLESFTLTAGLAAVTKKIKLYASVAVLTMPPPIAARMAVTIDSIASGRFGINIVSGWQKREYEQMGIWPGDRHFDDRYAFSAEYVQIMRELWRDGISDFKGKFFTMDRCQLLPKPAGPIGLVCAGQSDAGMDFCARYGDFNFIIGVGVNTPKAVSKVTQRLQQASTRAGRDVGAYVLFMVIADDTDQAAMDKWTRYKNGADRAALGWMAEQGAADTNAGADSSTVIINQPEGAVNLNMGTLVGSDASIARMLDEAATVPGVKGIILVFDDYLVGLDRFGRRIQPRMKCRGSA